MRIIRCTAILLAMLTLVRCALAQPTTAPSPAEMAAEDDWAPTGLAPLDVPKGLSNPTALQANTTGRGQADDGVQLAVLAPEAVGKTSRTQPVLAWHLSKPSNLPVIISISEAGNPTPLKRWQINAPQQAGFHRIDLAKENVSLVIGPTYEFVVALVQDPRRRSRDVVAIGYVQRVAADPAMDAKLARLRRIERVEPLAAADLFYDAAAEAVIAIDANPSNPAAAKYRQEFLNQMQLTETSTTDLRGR